MSYENPLPHIEGLVKDQFFKRQVIIYQKQKGYRFSVDAPLLADFLPECPEEHSLEIGPGSGVISLLALFGKKFKSVEAVEIQKDFYEIASLNSKSNGFDDVFKIRHGDICEEWKHLEKFKYIYSNPPFMPLTGGRISPNEEIAIAKNEVKINLKQLLGVAENIMDKEGFLFLVLPWNRYGELVKFSEQTGFYFFRLRKVLNEVNSGEPVRFLVQLSNYSSSFVEEDPLVLYGDKGIYSEEAERIFAGKK